MNTCDILAMSGRNCTWNQPHTAGRTSAIVAIKSQIIPLRTGNISTDGEYHFPPKAMAPYLLPKEASDTMRTAFIEVVGKQADEHDNK
jgi:hypothetical protein